MNEHMSVSEKIENGDYKTNLLRPLWEGARCLGCNSGLGDVGEFCPICGADVGHLIDAVKIKNIASVKSREENEEKLIEQFKKDVFEELNLSDHPKKLDIYYTALELASDVDDLSSILSEMEDLADFVLPQPISPKILYSIIDTLNMADAIHALRNIDSVEFRNKVISYSKDSRFQVAWDSIKLAVQ